MANIRNKIKRSIYEWSISIFVKAYDISFLPQEISRCCYFENCFRVLSCIEYLIGCRESRCLREYSYDLCVFELGLVWIPHYLVYFSELKPYLLILAQLIHANHPLSYYLIFHCKPFWISFTLASFWVTWPLLVFLSLTLCFIWKNAW